MRRPTLDPDGNLKRRAKKGELSCGDCEVQLPNKHGRWCRLRQQGSDLCHVTDFAGDCRWYTDPNDLDACARFERAFDRMRSLLVGGNEATRAAPDLPPRT